MSKKTMERVNKKQLIMGHEIEASAFSVTFDEAAAGGATKPGSIVLGADLKTKRLVTETPLLPEFLQSSRVITAAQLQERRTLFSSSAPAPPHHDLSGGLPPSLAAHNGEQTFVSDVIGPAVAQPGTVSGRPTQSQTEAKAVNQLESLDDIAWEDDS